MHHPKFMPGDTVVVSSIFQSGTTITRVVAVDWYGDDEGWKYTLEQVRMVTVHEDQIQSYADWATSV